jgi:hypothetical protein
MEEIMELLKLKHIRFREKYAEGEVPLKVLIKE